MWKKKYRLRYLLAILSLIIIVSFSCIYKYSYYQVKFIESKISKNEIKYILLWTNMFSSDTWYLGKNYVGEKDFAEFECPQTKCVVTTNRTLLDSVDVYDAVVFHGSKPLPSLRSLPRIRSAHQKYVISIQESPMNTQHLEHLAGYNRFFNWTMTYRLDADIVSPYGFIRDKENRNVIAPNTEPIWQKQDHTSIDSDLITRTKNKTGKIIWFVSNCNTASKRMELAERLSQYIPIDIYGQCGKLSCPVTEKDACYQKLENYKFYLAFENSLCTDYVTEKLYFAMTKLIVPITFGGADYKKFAPPKSFIDANDFATVAELADFLIQLDANPDEYVKYFWWRKYYTIQMEDAMHKFCALCVKLHKHAIQTKIEYYDDLQAWWFGTDEHKMCKAKATIDV